MKVITLICLLCFLVLQGCSQKHTPPNDNGFKTYVNTNDENSERGASTDEHSPPINVAF